MAPVIVRLLAVYRQTEGVEEQLLGLLSQLRAREQEAVGYGPTNLISLLRALRGHLRRLDLSHLSIRGAYLQGVEMPTGCATRETQGKKREKPVMRAKTMGFLFHIPVLT